jgi:hypothetical protein
MKVWGAFCADRVLRRYRGRGTVERTFDPVVPGGLMVNCEGTGPLEEILLLVGMMTKYKIA